MIAFVFVFFSGVASSLAGLNYKYWHRGGYRPDLVLGLFALVFTGLALLCALLFREPLYSPPAVWLGLLGGANTVATIRLMFAVTRRVKLSIGWTVMQFSVLVPLVIGVAAYGEPLLPATVAGTAMIFLSIGLFGAGKSSGGPATIPDLSSWALLLAATLLNGVFFTIPRVFAALSPRGGTFTLLLYAGLGMILAAGLGLVPNTVRGSGLRLPRGIGLLAAYMGLVNVLATALLVLALQRAPGTLVFPLRTVINLLSVFLLSYLLFREKMNLLEALGAAAALVGLALVSASL